MICHVLRAADFVADHGQYVRDHLTNAGSDFQRKLDRWLAGTVPTDEDGSIALAIDFGEVVGWCRTETWIERTNPTYLDQGEVYCWDTEPHDTLEAFVAPAYRHRGIAAWCASGLAATALCDGGKVVAVFHPHMILVARRAGFHPIPFHADKAAESGWSRL